MTADAPQVAPGDLGRAMMYDRPIDTADALIVWLGDDADRRRAAAAWLRAVAAEVDVARRAVDVAAHDDAMAARYPTPE